MKKTITIILIVLLALGNLYLFTKFKENNAALADANGKLNSIFLHTVQVKILDEDTKELVNGLSISYPQEPYPSTEIESVSEQHKVLFQDGNMNVLSKVGTKPLKLRIEAPGYETKEVEINNSDHGANTKEILLRKHPQIG